VFAVSLDLGCFLFVALLSFFTIPAMFLAEDAVLGVISVA
jgi:hypothetical protein